MRRVRELRDKGDYQLLADVLSSPMIMTLRGQELDLLRSEAELSGVYGEQHPRIRQLRAEKARVAERTQREIDGAIRNLENEAEAAQLARGRVPAKPRGSEDPVGAERSGRSPAEGARTRGRRQPHALRKLSLVRLKETELQQQLIQPDARVVSPAEVPQTPSSRSPLFFAIIGFTGSLFIGSTLAMVLDQMDSSLRTRRQVEELLRRQGARAWSRRFRTRIPT